MDVIETMPKKFFELFPNQTFILTGGGKKPFALRGVYSDEEFALANILETKTISQILQEMQEKISEMTDAIGSRTINAITKLAGEAKNMISGANFLANGGRTDTAPWTTWKKIIGHSHGIITINFVVVENVKKATEILNKISLQTINDYGFWSYEYTDALSAFIKNKSSSTTTKKANSTAEKIDQAIKNSIGKNLFRLRMGNWFDSGTMLLVQGCDYRIKTGVFDGKGNPEYLEVTLRLMPARQIGANDYDKWFLITK